MRNHTLSLVLVGAALLLSPLDSAALPPVPGPTSTGPASLPPPPPPGGGALTPTALGVDGIVPGMPMSAAEARCKAPGARCKTSTRKFGAIGVDKLRIDFTSGPYARAYVTAKGGTVLSVKGRYRTEDKGRYATLERTFGKAATVQRGLSVWTTGGGIVVSASGRMVHFTHPASATARGIPLTMQSFTVPKIRKLAIRPAVDIHAFATAGPAAAEGGMPGVIRPGQQFSLTPSPVVVQTLRIPVKFTLLQLECYDPQDYSTIFYGDDPYLNIWGTHTNAHGQKAWNIQRAFSDQDSGDVVNVNQAIFPDGDGRRFVSYGEAVGVEFTLVENDIGNDDEIDYGYPMVDYAFAATHQNTRQTGTEVLEGDGGVYTLTYAIDIGAGVPDAGPTSYAPVYRDADPAAFAGGYQGFAGTEPVSASLGFVASKGPAWPKGSLGGSFTEAGTFHFVNAARLQGSSVEFAVKSANAPVGVFVGHLIPGTPQRIVGTLTRAGVTRGVVLSKK